MKQFVPDDGAYVYFRYDNKQTVMVVMNTSKKDKIISFDNYKEVTGRFSHYTNILTNKKSAFNDFNLGTYQTVVLELNK